MIIMKNGRRTGKVLAGRFFANYSASPFESALAATDAGGLVALADPITASGVPDRAQAAAFFVGLLVLAAVANAGAVALVAATAAEESGQCNDDQEKQSQSQPDHYEPPGSFEIGRAGGTYLIRAGQGCPARSLKGQRTLSVVPASHARVVGIEPTVSVPSGARCMCHYILHSH